MVMFTEDNGELLVVSCYISCVDTDRKSPTSRSLYEHVLCICKMTSKETLNILSFHWAKSFLVSSSFHMRLTSPFSLTFMGLCCVQMFSLWRTWVARRTVANSFRAFISISTCLSMLAEIRAYVQHLPSVSLMCGIRSACNFFKPFTCSRFGNLCMVSVFINLLVLKLAVWALEVNSWI